MQLTFVIGKIKEAELPFHEYLKDKELVLGKFLDHWTLLGVVGDENTVINLCKYVWENDRRACEEEGYKTLEEFIENVELGNDGFGFDLDEIEVIETKEYNVESEVDNFE